MILTVTGHRPDKLGGYDQDTMQRLQAFAKQQLVELDPDVVITGMALGWDQAIARAAWQLQIPFHAYIPFVGQESRWPPKSQAAYHELRALATKTLVCFPQYAPWVMQERNKRMVNDGGRVLALWNGTPGGTANCVRYATMKGRFVDNCWDDWTNF